MERPSANWWQRYQDAQLNHLIEEALQHSPSLEMAMARLKGHKVLLVKQAQFDHLISGKRHPPRKVKSVNVINLPRLAMVGMTMAL